jgi:uncharacterized protein YuzB (UPF0349 family)
MGIVVVEVCDVNPASGLQLERLEEEHPGVSVIRSPCLSNCTMCATVPYAYVNGEMLTATTREELWAALKRAIEEELREWNVE